MTTSSMPKKVLPMFPRPLYNAGRWFPSYLNPKFLEGAVLEEKQGYLREVLPSGYRPFEKPPIVRTETASSVPSNGYSRFSITSHGGHCCGRLHIYGFGAVTKNDIGSLKGICTPRRGRGIEITLTDSQARRRGWEGYSWHEVLLELGWKYVFAFNNGNSGNNVRVYFFSTTERKLPK